MAAAEEEVPQSAIAVRDDDQDSAYSGDSESDVTSLHSSATRFVEENGRQYHGYCQGRYMYPCDEKEKDRLDMNFEMIYLALNNRHYLAPIPPTVSRILELGTGTGIWAITMGECFRTAKGPEVTAVETRKIALTPVQVISFLPPSYATPQGNGYLIIALNKQIIGNDLSPIQPLFVPPNVRFEVDDMENDWLHKNKFDFIFCRYMLGAIKDWPRLMRQAYENTAPGGWVEFQDWDVAPRPNDEPFPPGFSFAKLAEYMTEACQKAGREPSPGPKLKGWLEEAGFTNIKNETFPVPQGTWPKSEKLRMVGAWQHLNAIEGIEAFTMGPFTRQLKWTPEEVQVFAANIRRDLKNSKIHAVYTFHVAYGQKPVQAEDKKG